MSGYRKNIIIITLKTIVCVYLRGGRGVINKTDPLKNLMILASSFMSYNEILRSD